MKDIGFWLYMLFIISWLDHLTARLPALALIRFDLLIVAILFLLTIFKREEDSENTISSAIEKSLKLLICYSVATIPLVEWPGSVLRYGIQNFIKAVVFFFFTVAFVRTEKQLKILMAVFLSSQSFRIIEPLYLHITEGYWGSAAGMANWELLKRLSGAPHDVVNPNGLAFIIVTVLPFFFCYSAINKKVFLISIIAVPLFLWTLILTESRSGFVALLAIAVFFTMKSKKKFLIIIIAIVSSIIVYQNLTPDQKDRYLSIIDSNTKNAATAEGRYTGVIESFKAGLNRPIFGHGLGTSVETNAHFKGRAQPAHNLYVEVFQELGIIGLIIFSTYIFAIYKDIIEANRNRSTDDSENSPFVQATWKALWIFFFTNLLFSLVSYGLSGYEWYFIPGLVMVLKRIKTNHLKCGEIDNARAFA